MSTISKHFGLSYREESYIFKEHEKVRRQTKKDFLRLKQELASKTLVDRARVSDRRAPGPTWSGEQGGVPCAGPREPSGFPRPQGPAIPAAALLQRALRRAGPRDAGEGAAPWRPRRFRPRDFYLRSSAFLRHRPPKEPPVIATGAGTSRPVVLRPPPASRRKPGERWSPPPAEAQRVSDSAPAPARVPAPAPAQVPKLALAPPEGALAAREMKRRSTPRTSNEDGEAAAALRRRRVRISSQVLCEGALAVPRAASRSSSKSSADTLPASDRLAAVLLAPLPVRVVPTSIEEIIASLQSEAQLASDQTIRELIQIVLGQSYDIKMEDISLMGKMYAHRSSPVQTEQGLEISIEEPQMHETEEISETVSSVFPMEQEDILEWGTSDAESMLFKPQETSEIQQADDSNKPLEDEQSIGESKTGQRLSLKVMASELLQIRGKEAKRSQKTQPRIPRPRKCGKSQQDQKVLKTKIPQDHSTPTLHDLCTTVPDQVLPIDLHLASRVYHTASKEGHNTILEVFGNSFFDAHSTANEQRDRIMEGIPLMSDNQAYVPVLPTTSVIPPELAQETRQHAQKPHLQLFGEEVSAYPGITKMFWKPASPKFSVPVSVMKKTLYPKYESVQASRILIENFLSESKESVIALSQRSRSLRKRTNSAVELIKETTKAPLEVKNDMESNIKEVLFQKAKEMERRQKLEQNETEETITVKENIDNILDTMEDSHSLRNLSVSLIEASRKAGISYIVYPKKKKMKWKKALKFSKLSIVLAELSKPPKTLSRSMSHGMLPEQKKYLLNLPLYDRQFRCPSLPAYLNFDKFAESKGGIPKDSDFRTWILDIFSKKKPQKTTRIAKVVKIIVQKDVPVKEKGPPKLELNDSLKCDLPPEVIKHYESEVKMLTEEINNKTTYSAFSYCRRGALYRKLGKLQSAMDDLQEAYLSKAEIFRKRKEVTLAILNYTKAIKLKPRDADIYFRRGEMYELTNKFLAMDDFSTVSCITYNAAINTNKREKW
ncbi:uncharacterized protein LOC132230269 [Myotis daubentonii]|uniref:uncharacterized protein LOC132230269 n=1 Tax=Myotis daubentonii TaxID=98922 RepID=UPI002873AB87|nr:uncharacterized protein LOC132230269 [Myotis daubentonii]